MYDDLAHELISICCILILLAPVLLGIVVAFFGLKATQRDAQKQGSTSSPTRLKLVLPHGDEVLLNTGVLRLGRGKACDIVLSEGDISRQHAAIHATTGKIEVVDLGSRNGTCLDGIWLQPHVSYPLRAGSSLRLGGTLNIQVQRTARTKQRQTRPSRSAQTVPTREPSEVAIQHYNRAIDVWENLEEGDRDETVTLDIMADLALAIDRANAPFPRAHALLAMCYNDLGDDNKAQREAKIALAENPKEFRAQLVLIDVVLKGVKVLKLSPFDVIEWSDDVDQMIAGSVARMGGAMFAAMRVSYTQSRFRREVEKLVRVFKEACREESDPGEYLMMCEAMILMGDLVRRVPMSGGRPNLYAAVLNTPTDRLEISEQVERNKIAEVRRKAMGRALLLEPQSPYRTN